MRRAEPLGLRAGRHGRARVSGCGVLGERLAEGRAHARRGSESLAAGGEQTLEEGDAAAFQVFGFRGEGTEPQSSAAICPKSRSLNV